MANFNFARIKHDAIDGYYNELSALMEDFYITALEQLSMFLEVDDNDLGKSPIIEDEKSLTDFLKLKAEIRKAETDDNSKIKTEEEIEAELVQHRNSDVKKYTYVEMFTNHRYRIATNKQRWQNEKIAVVLSSISKADYEKGLLELSEMVYELGMVYTDKIKNIHCDFTTLTAPLITHNQAVVNVIYETRTFLDELSFYLANLNNNHSELKRLSKIFSNINKNQIGDKLIWEGTVTQFEALTTALFIKGWLKPANENAINKYDIVKYGFASLFSCEGNSMIKELNAENQTIFKLVFDGTGNGLGYFMNTLLSNEWIGINGTDKAIIATICASNFVSQKSKELLKSHSIVGGVSMGWNGGSVKDPFSKIPRFSKFMEPTSFEQIPQSFPITGKLLTSQIKKSKG